MCGPSGAMQSLNNTIQSFTGQVTKEAGTVFGAANTVFNNIMNAVQGIVASGPNQMGFSTAEDTALNAGATTSGATLTRNLKAVATTSGGNVATPGGANIAAVDTAEQTGAAETAQQKNEIAQADAAVGRENYWSAVNTELQAPNVFGVANPFNETAGQQLGNAEKSQQAMDMSKSWWKDPVMKIGAAAAQFIPYAGPYVSSAIKQMDQNYNQTMSSEQSDIGDVNSGWDQNS